MTNITLDKKYTPALKSEWHIHDEQRYRVSNLIKLHTLVEEKKEVMATLEVELNRASAQELIIFSHHLLSLHNSTLNEKVLDILTLRILPWTEC